MLRPAETDEAVVERARQCIAAKRRLRWGMLINAAFYLGFSGYCTFLGVQKVEGLEEEQLQSGFVYGLALAVFWTSFGLIGAVFLGKFLVGFKKDFRTQELLVRYYDRLRELDALEETGNKGVGGQTGRKESEPRNRSL